MHITCNFQNGIMLWPLAVLPANSCHKLLVLYIHDGQSLVYHDRN